MHIQERRYARTTLETGDKGRNVRTRSETFHGVDDLPPVTFLSSQSFLSLPKWDAYKNGSISLKFRTNEGNGVLIFSHGIRNEAGSDDSDSNYDYFAIELLSGQLTSLPVILWLITSGLDTVFQDCQWLSIRLFH